MKKPMTEQEQIEEMARVMANGRFIEPQRRHILLFIGEAEAIYNAGYRKQEWISVEDRLPSKEELERSQFHNFLTANEFGEVREAVFTGEYFAKLGSRLSGVTHWMPPPEPPKGGE